MTPDELRAIRERCEAATPGEWLGTANSGVVTGDGEATVFETGCGCCTGSKLTEADAAFIAAARTDVPALLDEVERLTHERDDALCDLKEIAELVGEGGDDSPFGRVESMLMTLTGERNDAIADAVESKNKVHHLCATMRATNEEIRELRASRDEARAEVERLKESVQWQKAVIDGYAESQERLAGEVKEARAEVERLTRMQGVHPSSLTDVVTALEDERDELLVRVANADAELRATRESYNELRAILGAGGVTYSEGETALRAQLAEAHAQAFIREQDVQAMRDKLKELEAQLSGKPGGFEP